MGKTHRLDDAGDGRVNAQVTMGSTGSQPDSAVNQTVEHVVPKDQRLFSPDEVVELAWRASLHLHLPFDPVDAEVRLETPADGADFQSIPRPAARKMLVLFLEQKLEASTLVAPDATSGDGWKVPLKEEVQAAREWIADFDRLQTS